MKLSLLAAASLLGAAAACALEPIVVAPDGEGFIAAETHTPFQPWGLNYGNAGRLMEDFWDADWETFAGDFAEMKQLGANVVRVHLQFGKFMSSAEAANPAALAQLTRLLRLAEETGLYLDVTGLASYRPADAPAWYDALDDGGRWAAQARFWSAIAKACTASPAVFCYDLMNEPIVAAARREAGQWRSGKLLGGYDFVQFITLDPPARTRAETGAEWIHRMREAIREQDKTHLITVGLLPWMPGWKHLSGFEPEIVAPELDFISVHIYPDSKKPEEAMESLSHFVIPGKPLVIEETFNLSCSPAELERFIVASRAHAVGWVGHYDGTTIAEYEAARRKGTLTVPQAAYLEFLRLFVRLKP
jgi:hypothetical protein